MRDMLFAGSLVPARARAARVAVSKADLLSIDPSGDSVFDLSGSVNPTASVQPGRPGLDLAPGVAKATGNPLDFALAGPGLFVVETPAGERYTPGGPLCPGRRWLPGNPGGIPCPGHKRGHPGV